MASHLRVLTIVFVFTCILTDLAAWANELQQSSTGWIWLILTISATSFPPMIGWTTCCMITGFGFGFRHGFLIALAGTLLGSMITFTIARYFLARYAKQMMEKQTTLRALGGAIVSGHSGHSGERGLR